MTMANSSTQPVDIADISDATLTHRLGHAELSPKGPVVAGSVGQWTLTYTVGSYGIDEGGTIKIARRFASDWAKPQFDAPTEPNYCSVRTDGEAKIHARYDAKAHIRPWMKCVVLDVYDGSLAPGDQVVVVFGDQSQGSVGIRSQTFIESRHEMRVLVDPTNACLVRRIPSSPEFAIVPGESTAISCVTPTCVQVGTTAPVHIDGIDTWGNPRNAPPDVELRWQGSGEVNLTADGIEFKSPGSGRVVARWGGREYFGNPLRAQAKAPEFGRHWADLHAQSDATVGTGTEHEYFEFGRKFAHLDIMSHQGNDFQMDDEDWARLGRVVREHHEDGAFVVFPGFEWSANSTAGGDRNVLYLDDGQPIMRSSHWQVPDVAESAVSPAHPADDLFAKLKRNCDPERVLVAAHCGGRYADIRLHHDPQLERLVELCSCWGVFEWLLWDAYDHDYRVGVMCNSDGHKGRPGLEGPGAGQFGILGGLTCVLARELTRQSVFEALRARRCYGTTGPRIDIELEVDGAAMGSEIGGRGRVRVCAGATTTTPLECIELYAGKRVIARSRPDAFDTMADSRRVRLWWGGARIRGRGRRAVWDGAITAEGVAIEKAESFAFDAPLDGIELVDAQCLKIRSRTTGDIDGVDIYLDSSTGGRLRFRSEQGEFVVELDQLDTEITRKEFGGLDLHACAMRHPERLTSHQGRLDGDFELPTGTTTPLMIKVTQEDGHMAWTSPVYVTR